MNALEKLDYHRDRIDSLSGAMPLTGASTTILLNEILESARQNTLAFDLDSTLLNNRPRNAVIMREFGELHCEPLLSNANAEHFQDWSARNAMTAMGLPRNTVEHLLDAYRSYWSEQFFTSEYCQHDIVVPGASEFVTAARDNGGTICYLTGRHEGMRAGTEASLQKLGFPVPGSDRVKLLMKPDKDQSDDLFKIEALQKIEITGVIRAAFDNEPTHINSYRTAFPDAVCVHLLTDHSMRAVKLLSDIFPILNFVR